MCAHATYRASKLKTHPRAHSNERYNKETVLKFTAEDSNRKHMINLQGCTHFTTIYHIFQQKLKIRSMKDAADFLVLGIVDTKQRGVCGTY
jgi:glutamate racemase